MIVKVLSHKEAIVEYQLTLFKTSGKYYDTVKGFRVDTKLIWVKPDEVVYILNMNDVCKAIRSEFESYLVNGGYIVVDHEQGYPCLIKA